MMNSGIVTDHMYSICIRHALFSHTFVLCFWINGRIAEGWSYMKQIILGLLKALKREACLATWRIILLCLSFRKFSFLSQTKHRAKVHVTFGTVRIWTCSKTFIVRWMPGIVEPKKIESLKLVMHARCCIAVTTEWILSNQGCLCKWVSHFHCEPLCSSWLQYSHITTYCYVPRP